MIDRPLFPGLHSKLKRDFFFLARKRANQEGAFLSRPEWYLTATNKATRTLRGIDSAQSIGAKYRHRITDINHNESYFGSSFEPGTKPTPACYGGSEYQTMLAL